MNLARIPTLAAFAAGFLPFFACSGLPRSPEPPDCEEMANRRVVRQFELEKPHPLIVQLVDTDWWVVGAERHYCRSLELIDPDTGTMMARRLLQPRTTHPSNVHVVGAGGGFAWITEADPMTPSEAHLSLLDLHAADVAADEQRLFAVHPELRGKLHYPESVGEADGKLRVQLSDSRWAAIDPVTLSVEVADERILDQKSRITSCRLAGTRWWPSPSRRGNPAHQYDETGPWPGQGQLFRKLLRGERLYLYRLEPNNAFPEPAYKDPLPKGSGQGWEQIGGEFLNGNLVRYPTYCPDLLMAGPKGTVFVQSDDALGAQKHRLTAIDRGGRVAWSILSEGSFVLGTRDTLVYEKEDRLWGIRARDGSIAWEYPAPR